MVITYFEVNLLLMINQLVIINYNTVTVLLYYMN